MCIKAPKQKYPQVVFDFTLHIFMKIFLNFIFDIQLYLFRTDLLSIIMRLDTVFAANGICYTSYVDCLLADSQHN